MRLAGTPLDPTQSLDPQEILPADPGINLLAELYAGLLRYDSNLVLVPDLAEQVPSIANGGLSEDGLTYTFRLQEGLKWSDGSSLVAQDFVNARTARNPASLIHSEPQSEMG